MAGTQVGLRTLEVLILAGNAAISDIANLAGLVNLSELYLSGTGLAAYSQSTEESTMIAHTYADSGVYTARLTITDPHGGVDIDEVIVTINNHAPANLTLAGDANSLTLVVTSIQGSLIDINALLPNGTDLEPVSGSIDFGDGLVLPITIQRSSTTPQATYTFDAQTIYRQPGNYLVQVTVEDDDFGRTVAPSAAGSPAAALQERDPSALIADRGSAL